jgi:hypothetical protein
MKLNREDRREEMGAYATMISLGIVSIVCIIVLIKKLIYG